MKPLKIALLFLIFCFSATAKDSTTVEFKRFALGIHGSPDYCFRKLKAINPNIQPIIAYREETEFPAFGYTAGAELSFFIKKQFAISLGANFSQKAYQTELYTMVDNNGMPLGKVKFRYTYNYIEIPFKANFILGKKKIHFIASAGVSSAFLLYQQTISKYEYIAGDLKETKKGQPNYIYNPFNLFLNGSIGIDCQLGKKMGLKIEPTYNYGLLQTIDASITEKLWSAGLNIGCYIKL